MDSVRVIGKRMSLALKLLKRDPTARLMTIFGFIFMLLLINQVRQTKAGAKDDIFDNTYGCFQIGFITAFIYFASFTVAVGDFVKERKCKMASFLNSIGVTPLEYYGFYVLWSWILATIFGTITFILVTIQGVKDTDYLRCILVGTLSAIANALFGSFLLIFFKGESMGMSIYMLANSLSLGLIGALAKDRKALPLANIIPAGKLLDVMLFDSFKPEEASSLGSILLVQFAQVVVYGFLVVVAQNITTNEYGFHHKNYIFKRKVDKGVDEGRLGSQLGEQLIDERDTRSNLFDANIQPDQIMLEVKNVHKSFDANVVLEGVSFVAGKGEISCILGPNGAGKSTLFNIILENVEYESGEINKNWGEKSISFCPQEDIGWEYVTVAEHIDYVQRIQEIKENHKTSNKEYVDKIVDICNLTSHWTKRVKELSGGFKRRLSIGMALLANPDIILMDEPTTALDMEIRYNIMKGFYRIRDELGTTILYTTHHLEDAENFSDKIMMLAKGRIIINGSMNQLRTKFNMATLTVKFTDVEQLQKARTYFEANFDNNISSIELQEDRSSIIIRTPYTSSEKRMIEHIQFFEAELGGSLELRQTSLEEVYLMEGDVDKYSELDKLGKSDLSETWAKLLTHPRRKNFLNCFLQVLRKSKVLIM